MHISNQYLYVVVVVDVIKAKNNLLKHKQFIKIYSNAFATKKNDVQVQIGGEYDVVNFLNKKFYPGRVILSQCSSQPVSLMV